MRIEWLKPLVGHPGPFATVYLDATRSVEAGDKDVANRWRSVRRSLVKQGAAEEVLADLDEAVDRPTRVRGPHGRVLIADADGVLVDRVLREPPSVMAGVWHQVPSLLQAARSADEAADALCVAVDRLGADFFPVGSDGYPAGPRESFEGPHDEISKTSSTSTKRATIESRAEDSWQRNAEAVAGEIDRRVAQQRPEIVMITGDVRAVPLVRAALGQQAREATVEVPGGGRDDGVHQGAFAESVADALDSFRERRREQVLAELREGLGREAGAVTSIDDVVQVLARGQVKHLVLSEQLADDAARALRSWVDSPAESPGPGGLLNGRRLWIGPDPLHVAVARGELTGVDDPEELPAASALLRAAIGQDAGLVFAPEGSVDLRDGVGATLRWHDGGTPHESAATMSGDDGRVSTAH
ncbi:baeRF2 domain-containing protein [Isoptericola aurantiacus]|uniref:baeRF2 domain-containing protein n=1 Tax=Isoptericola aurantiacus TaxID=3377839 RepID=UPI00383A7B38